MGRRPINFRLGVGMVSGMIASRRASFLTPELGFALLLSGVVAAAQQSPRNGMLELSLAPMRVDLDHLKPLQSYTDAAIVTNTSAETQRVVAWAADWRLNEQSLPVYFEAGSLPAYSCGSWITANPAEFELAPGKSQRVRFTLTVPRNASDAGFHCALMFQTVVRPATKAEANTMRTQLRLVTTLYATVGSPVAEPRVESFALVLAAKPSQSKPGDDPQPSWNVEVTLANPSETHYRAQGTVKLLDSSGHVLETFNLENSPVLPKTQRKFSWPFHGDVGPGDYHLQGSFDFGQKSLSDIEKTVTISSSEGKNPARS